MRLVAADAKIAVDKWHLVALANTVVTEVRQRVTRERYGRRGTTAEKVWVNRHLLLTGYEHLSAKQRARLKATFAGEDPTNEIGAAWGVNETSGFRAAPLTGWITIAAIVIAAVTNYVQSKLQGLA